jgi:hypothetical protein
LWSCIQNINNVFDVVDSPVESSKCVATQNK